MSQSSTSNTGTENDDVSAGTYFRRAFSYFGAINGVRLGGGYS
ncbi:hypothetical protein CCACVL1_12828 [Corchorus capsularis]|uniref:Uncharacterized protein n=1 Tax=Corchorus capsularis TaxID=210143 RepID=A0A1R3IDJ9_COCAP|nr:hypothetical protein CCACVL1_12828 [Corchorus capsularis]